MSGIAGGSEQFSAGVSGLVKKNLDCTVVMYFNIDYLRRYLSGYNFRTRLFSYLSLINAIIS